MTDGNPVTQLYSLAALSGAAPAREELERAVAGLGGDGWARLISAARRHGVLPLACGNLSRCGLLEEIPAEAAGALRKGRGAAAAMNMLLLDLRDRTARAAAGAGVPLMPLKGAYLIGKYYEAEERPMTDVDFLVEPGRAADIRSLMGELGFKSEQGTRLRGEFEEKYSGEEKFSVTAAGAPATVEMHRELLPTEALRRAFPLRAERLWANAARDEAGVHTPCVEHALLFGALHLGPTHCFSRLMWLADEDRMLRGGDIRWDFLSEESARAGASPLMYYTLRASNRLYGSPLPEGLKKFFPPHARRIPDDKIDGWLAAGEEMTGAAMMQCLLSEKRAEYLLGRLFPPPEYIMLRYGIPWCKLPAYYAARPFSLLTGAKGRAGGEKRQDGE